MIKLGTCAAVLVSIAGIAGAQAPAQPAAEAESSAKKPAAREGYEPTRAPILTPPTRELRYTLRGDAIYAFPTDVQDAPGRVTYSRAEAELGLSIPTTDTGALNVSFSTGLINYDFSDATTIIPGTNDPWSTVLKHSVGVLHLDRLNDRWGYLAGGGITSTGEAGASFGDTITGSAVGGLRYAFNEKFSLGLGAFARTRIEDNVLVIPIIFIDWKITEELRLTNESRLFLSLFYTPREDVSFLLTGGWDTEDFRLDDDAPNPDGVVRDSRGVIAVGAQWKPTENWELTGRVGAMLFQEFRIDDAGGVKLRDVNTDPTGFVALTVQYNF